MKPPWEYFEELNEIVYVCDLETHDLIYMNQYAKKLFSIVSPEDYVGKKCYVLLQGLQDICPFCSNENLEEGKFFEWSYRNPILKRSFLLKDTLIEWQGRKCRMEIAVNSGEEFSSINGLSHLESLINDCLFQTHFTADPNETLNMMVGYLGEKLNCNRVDIYEIKDKTWLYHTYSWNKSREHAIKSPFKIDDSMNIDDWYKTLQQNGPIVLTDDHELKKQVPKIYDYFVSEKNTITLVIPLLYKETIKGFFCLEHLKKDPFENVKEIGKMSSYFITSVLERRDLVEYLKFLGYHDQLTNALNRYALNEYIASNDFDQNIGMVYCDIIGLKNVNDMLGHSGGDRLIIQTYEALASVFSPDQVYRIGGDEFLVVCGGVEESEFELKLELLKREVTSRNCDLSIGSVWEKAGKKDFRLLLKKADESMYKEKKNFYSQEDPNTGKIRKLQRRVWETDERLSVNQNPFREFTDHYYFDAESFFRSIAMEDTAVYLYCGDMQKNIFYISDNLRKDFNFSSNLIYDFVTLLERRIFEEDRQAHIDDMKSILAEKKTVHSIRYRIYNKKGEPVWMHCRGILKWNEDKTEPLFFSGSMILMNNEAEVDPATGMMNLPFALDKILESSEKNKERIVLCFALNNFSSINQMMGREKGDLILWEISCQLKQELGDNFQFIRMESLRFMAITEELVAIEPVIQKIYKIIADIYRRHGAYIIYPCTIGVLRSPRDGSTAKELMENAVAVLQAAKSSPEVRYLEFSPDLSKKYKDKTDINMALNASINHMFEGFRIVVQPQVQTKTGKILSGEVLLRWQNQGRNVSPGEFIPVLEHTGLIIPVGKWIVAQVIQSCREIIKIMPDFHLSFNVSYLQVIDETFLPFIERTMKAYNVPGKNIQIELTETHFDEMPEQLECFVQQCKNLGITFALDDFGSAYSSLRLLLQYPADLIKLDRTLMQEVTSSKEKLNFIMSVIYACHKFGKKVCVEGVEKEEELQIVQQTDCDLIQGFYFYKPLELDDLYSVLKSCQKSSEVPDHIEKENN